jgi:hypothetical protein
MPPSVYASIHDETKKQLTAARSKVRELKKASVAPAAAVYTAGGVTGGGALAGVLQVTAPTLAGADSRLLGGLLLVVIAAASRGPSASLVCNVGSGLLAGYAQDLTAQALDPQ